MRKRLLLLVLAVCAAGLAAEPIGIYASANGVQRARVWPGSPLIVQAVVAGGENMPSVEHWRIELLDPRGEPSRTRFRTLGAEVNLRQPEWVIEPELTRDLEPGIYTVRITNVDARIAPAVLPVSVVTRPEAPGAADLRRAFQWQVHYEGRTGRSADAENTVDTWLLEHPDDGAAVAMKAQMLDQSGKLADALLAYNRAIELEEAARSEMNSREPAVGLITARDALLSRIRQRAGDAAANRIQPARR
jgi:hypothetical protein